MTVDTIEWAGLAELARVLETGDMTAVELTQAFLDRIEALDGLTNALRVVNPDALDIAAERDRERAAGAARGPLHGIPVLVKDNLDTGDCMPTTVGSVALENTFAARDATAVAKLRDAGAVLLGKTNLSEWANFRSVRSTSGWSSLGGQVRNPHALDRTPGGSSSGSAVSVAAGYCPVSVGTDTSGSILHPASLNGIVGIRPTFGLVSRAGIAPIAPSQDTAGPFGRTVADAAALLSVLAGTDSADPATASADPQRAMDYAVFADADGLRGRRIGLAVNYCGFDERVDSILAECLGAIRDGGGTVVEVELVTVADVRPSEFHVLMYEFGGALDAYLAGRGDGVSVRTLEELIDYNRRNADRVMPYFPQDILERAHAMAGGDAKAYEDARAAGLRLARDEGLHRVITENRLDAVVAATACLPWLIDWVNGDNRRGSSTTPSAVAGYPNLSVPAGFMYGLPLNVSFMGLPWSEPTLIAIAAGFEHVMRARRNPQFKPTADFSADPRLCLPTDFSPRENAIASW